MYIAVLVVHVIVCFVLIFVVLLQAGRGGGFSEMMGGGQPQSLFGTQTNAFMTRATEVCAVVFIITSLALGMMSTQKGKSLMERESARKAMQHAALTPDALKKALADMAQKGALPKKPASTAAPTVAPTTQVDTANKVAATNPPAASPSAAATTVASDSKTAPSAPLAEKTAGGNAH